MAGIACVTVNYRNPEDTLACLASLRLPGAEGFKVFLVNNHASDGSGETLQRYLRASGLAFHLDPGKNAGFTGGPTGASEGLTFWIGADFAQNSAPVLRWLALAGLIGSLANIPYAFVQGISRPDITAGCTYASMLSPRARVVDRHLWHRRRGHGLGGSGDGGYCYESR